jgi:hypothetical protein
MSEEMEIPSSPDWLALDDAALLAQCDSHVYKSSGPGGQHRNKVSSAVRLRHRPTGITVHGDDSRSQHENRALALKRLRMEIALHIRRPLPGGIAAAELPPLVRQCIFSPRGKGAQPGVSRFEVGRKDERFWPVSQFLLDLLEAHQGRLAEAADCLGITTSNLIAHIKKDRHLFGAAQELRKRHGHGTIK